MKFKKYLIGIFLLLSMFSLSINNCIGYQKISAITDFTYSDNIIPGKTFVWDVKKFGRQGNFVDDEWTIKTGKTVEPGDKIKIEITKDPDELSIANYTELFTTGESWAKFYLNDDLLGSNASVLNLYVNRDVNNYIIWTFLLPTLLEIDDNNVNSFQYFYDQAQPYEFNNATDLYDLTLTNDLLIMHYEYHHQEVYFFVSGIFYINCIFEASYNLQLGYLDKLELYHQVKHNTDISQYHLILLNELSTQKVGINWIIGIIPLCIIGLADIYNRKRRK